MNLPKSTEEIEQKCSEIENRLKELIISIKLDISFDEIKKMIYSEQDQDTLHEIMNKFDTGQDVDELNEVLAVVNEAWNYFPHKVLDGLSPMEKIIEGQQ